MKTLSQTAPSFSPACLSTRRVARGTQATPLVSRASPLRMSGPQSRGSFSISAAATETEQSTRGEAPSTSGGLSVAPTIGREDVVLFQAFGWSSCDVGGWYNIVKEKVETLKAAGVTHVWLPPPSESVSKQGYLPGQLYDLSTPYGNKKELQALNAALKEAGIAPVADIVINHRCAQEKGPDGKYNDFRDDIEHEGRSVDWGAWAITQGDTEFAGKGSQDTGEDYHAAPDLDHTNDELRASLKDWLNWLKTEIGFEGWRFDFSKGYAADYTREYCEETVGNNVFNVGEYWVDLVWGDNGLDYNQDGPRQILCNWLDAAGGTTAFDFVTKGILTEAVKNCEYWRLIDCEGRAPGLMGFWPSKAVTFIDNHDTGSTQQHWPFPGGAEETGYAYILSHPGLPSILWEHYFDYGLKDSIDTLLSIRRRNGIKAKSSLEIKVAEADLYLAVVGDSLTVKLGPRHDLGDLLPKEEEGWKFAASGKDYAIWEKASC